MDEMISDLWQHISAEQFRRAKDDDFIATFRRPGGANNRLAAWDPIDKTMRYYKSMMFTEAVGKPPRFLELYRSIANVQLGDPIHVRVRGCDINLDYLLAVEEAMFLASHLPSEIESVIEIGAGFGRTCHTLLAALPTIARYTIVDIPDVLALSHEFLRRAVPEHFSKLSFVDATKKGSVERFVRRSGDQYRFFSRNAPLNRIRLHRDHR